MNIIIGETENSKYRFVKKIGNKTFTYNGIKENIVFLEELIYNAILKDTVEEILVITNIKDDKYVLSFFNDINESSQKGESSIEYSIKEFSEEKIKNFINVFIGNKKILQNNIFYITLDPSNEEFNFYDSENNLKLNTFAKDIEHEEFISGFKKYKNVYILSSILLIILIAGIYGSVKINSYIEQENYKIGIEIKKIAMEKGKIEREVKIGSVKYLELSKDDNSLFKEKNNKKLIEQINSLNLIKEEK